MVTMAEIERDYPERLVALQAAMSAMTMTTAEFAERLTAGLELLYRAAR